MIEYSLECLEASGVKEVFVLCCSFARQVKAYLQRSSWMRKKHIKIHPIMSEDCVNAGDALRHLHNLQVIDEEFILISGDVVSNINLSKVLEEHRARVKADNRNIMTMVLRKVDRKHRSKCLEDDHVFLLDPDTKQVLSFQNAPEDKEAELDVSLLAQHKRLQFRYDLMDTFIDICSEEVLGLFADNFDYLDLRKDFVAGVLGSDILGNKIHMHEISTEYAARIKDFHTYDSVSRDIIQRWTFPLTLDNNFAGNSFYSASRGNRYKEVLYDDANMTVQTARSAVIGENTVIGLETSIGEKSVISNSVIGRNCKIGKNVKIIDSYLWGSNVIGDNVTIRNSLLAQHVEIGSDSKVEPGCVIGRHCVIGKKFTVAPYTMLTTKRIVEVDDDIFGDVNFGGDTGFSDDPASDHTTQPEIPLADFKWDPSVVGENGVGLVYTPEAGDSDSDEEEDYCTGRKDILHCNSLLPVYTAAYDQVLTIKNGLRDFDIPEDRSYPSSPMGGPMEDALHRFVREMKATVRRGVEEKLPTDAITLEVSSLKLSHDATIMEYGNAVFQSMFPLIDPQPVVNPDSRAGATAKITTPMLGSLKKLLSGWGILLSKYGRDVTDQVDLIFGLQNACLEPLTASLYSGFFHLVLQLLYEDDVLSEEAIIAWDEKVTSNPMSDALKSTHAHASKFVDWLKEAEEESSDEESGSEEEDEEDSD
jgi:translation initiation factor eIF-2B subunit epsilon